MQALRTVDRERPDGQVPLPVALTSAMGLALAAGLHFFGWLASLNGFMNGVFMDLGEAKPADFLPQPALWLATTVLTLALTWVILRVPATWRRVVLWISTLVVIAGWIPVGAIAATMAPVAAPLVSCGWAGLCAMVYAHHHHMEADGRATMVAESTTPENATDGHD